MKIVWSVSKLLCLPVGFLEKWDQCVINVLRGEFYCSTLPTLLLHGRVPLLVTGPHERLKVQYHLYILQYLLLSTGISCFSVAFALQIETHL